MNKMELMQKRDPLRWQAPESQRLRWVRLAERIEKSEIFARRVGIGTTTYSQYENGVRLSRDAAVMIANRVPGLTTDYLLRGSEEGLSVDLRRRIEAAREKEQADEGAAKEAASTRGRGRV